MANHQFGIKCVLMLSTVIWIVSALDGPNICLVNDTYVEISPKQKSTSAKKLINTTSEVCCKGYTIRSSSNQCEPLCSTKCEHGRCVGLDKCECNLGYGGPNCNIFCQRGKYGKDCQKNCTCQNNAVCDPATGSCKCSTGWTGNDCEFMCPEGTYGVNCEEKCKCRNDGYCDPFNGECHCSSPYYGAYCEKECSLLDRLFGNCDKEKECQNYGSYNWMDQQCFNCAAGWQGPACTVRCSDGYWGEGCSQKCECYNNAFCNKMNGSCNCVSGFIGRKCSVRCPDGTWGLGCKNVCSCKNGAKCDATNGTCTCKGKWKGVNCDLKCAEDRYGPKCEEKCKCVKGRGTCDHNSGGCICESPYYGPFCEEECPLFDRVFGNCIKEVMCQNNGRMNRNSGLCEDCDAGWTGAVCANPCPDGFWGKNCANKLPREMPHKEMRSPLQK